FDLPDQTIQAASDPRRLQRLREQQKLTVERLHGRGGVSLLLVPSDLTAGVDGPRRGGRDGGISLHTRDLRPRVRVGHSPFTALLLHAPGMNTTPADVNAVLEAEAAPTGTVVTGRVADDARRLIERARSGGWRRVEVAGREGLPAFTVVCDGQGR